MNEKGSSFPESILVLSIISIIFVTLLPLGTQLYKTINNKKTAVFAAETLFQGAIQYKTNQIYSGSRIIEGSKYFWYVNEDSICVDYKIYSEDIQKCVQY